jgi:hypothetical protein
MLFEAKQLYDALPNAREVALQACVDDYNNYGVAQTQQKYRMTDYEFMALRNLIVSVAPDVLILLRKHLDAHKERDAGRIPSLI